MLLGKLDYMNVYRDNWIQQTKYGKTTIIYDNDKIAYAHADFDEMVLGPQDLERMTEWATELKLDGTNPVALYKSIAKDKKNPYKRTSSEELKYFNRTSWLSLMKKGEILIESFKDQFLPRVKKVHAVQKETKLGDGTHSIMGVIDMVIELEGYDKPIIFDLKTSAQPYTPDKIDITEQLTLYLAMEGANYQTNLAGYVILVKNIPKETVAVCKNCQHIKDSRHQTCNNVVNDVRCNGEWDSKTLLKPEVQVMIAEKSEAQINDLLNDYNNVIHAMDQNIIYKNMDKCSNWFGSKCQYYALCHEGKMDGLKKRGT